MYRVFLRYLYDSPRRWLTFASSLLLGKIHTAFFSNLVVRAERRAWSFYGAVHLPDAWHVRNAFFCIHRFGDTGHLPELEIADTADAYCGGAPLHLRIPSEYR